MGIKGARVYSDALKQEIVWRLEAGEGVAAVAKGAGIDPKLLSTGGLSTGGWG